MMRTIAVANGEVGKILTEGKANLVAGAAAKVKQSVTKAVNQIIQSPVRSCRPITAHRSQAVGERGWVGGKEKSGKVACDAATQPVPASTKFKPTTMIKQSPAVTLSGRLSSAGKQQKKYSV